MEENKNKNDISAEKRIVLFEKYNWFTVTFPIILRFNKAKEDNDELEAVQISGELIEKVKEMGIDFDDYLTTINNFAYRKYKKKEQHENIKR